MTEKKTPTKTKAKADESKLPAASETDNAGHSTGQTEGDNGAKAEAAVLNPADGTAIPATKAQAEATTSNVADPDSEAAAQVQDKTVGEAYTGTFTDPHLTKQDDDEDTKRKPATKYKATTGFRHGFEGGRQVVGVAGEPLPDLTAAEAKELLALGRITAD